MIERELKHVFEELANAHFLEGLPRREFARRVAGLFSEINRIHPFREGNGRVQRQFVRQLADSLGFKLHFEAVSKERLIQASILSANGDVAMMERVLDEITDTERIQSLAKVIAHWREVSSSGTMFIWQRPPPVRAMPALSPVATEPTFLRDDESRIFVGNLKDLKRPAESGEKISFTAS